ncbi:transposase [Tolypothrix sp. NIES-4075]|nr:transposase [Tolypothrix sp. NIES-4075]
MTRLYARALKGKRAHPWSPDKRGKNVTIIGAIATHGIVGAMTFKGGNDKNAFETYINQVLVPNLWEGACVVVVLALIKWQVSKKLLNLSVPI